jgi:hypothetical protein
MRRFKGEVMRATLLDACGSPIHGAASTAVTKGFAKVAASPNYENATDYLMRNANDEFEINEQGLPLLRWWEVTIDFINVDPAWLSILTGVPLVLDDSSNVIGWRSRESVTSYFALEMWSALAGAPCAAGTKPHAYQLLPYLINGRLGDVTVENAAATFTVVAHTHNNSLWGTGPYNIRLNGSSVASPLLSPIASTDHFHTEVSFQPPPSPTTGAVALP